MQIRGVSLHNIRSFEEAELALGPGTTLIVGDVGAGKTSLLYAVEMALFGVAEVDAGYLVRHGRSESRVSVRLEEDEHKYEISRRFRRVRRRGRESFEPLTITFSEDGHPTSYSATELRRRVIELVGFPDNPNPQAHSDLWRWAIYVPQERMREILAADPEDRLETVRKALGVERFRTAAENAASLAADLRSEARQRREGAGRLAHWDEELARVLKEAEDLRQERLRREQELAAEGVSRDAARAQVSELEAEESRRNEERRQLDALELEEATDRRSSEEAARRRAELDREGSEVTAELQRAASELARRPSLETQLRAQEGERQRLEAELRSLEELLRMLAAARAEERANRQALEELERRAASLRGQRTDLARELAASEAQGPSHAPPVPTHRDLAEIDRTLGSAREAEHAAVDRLAVVRGDLAALTELLGKGVCPTCHQHVSSSEFTLHREEVARAAADADRSRAAAQGVRERLEEERKSRERYERAQERWTEVERRRAGLRQSMSTADEELHRIDLETQRRMPSPPPQETEVRWREAEARQQELRAASEKASAERASTAGLLEAVARAEERHRGMERSLERTREDLDRLGREDHARAERAKARAGVVAPLRARLAATADIPDTLERRRSDLKLREEKVTRAREALVRVETRQEGLSARVALAERGRADRAALVEEAGELEARASWIAEPLRYHLLAMERDLLTHAQSSFDRAFSRYFAALLDDPTLVARTDAAFTPEVTINGEPTPAEALSGGERTSLALAFRLALASTVRALGEVRLESLLLDEPTDGFSAEQVVRMGELLEELALPQVVIVSHEQQLIGIADRTIRVSKRDGRSALEGAEPWENRTLEAASSKVTEEPSSARIATGREGPARRRAADDGSSAGARASAKAPDG